MEEYQRIMLFTNFSLNSTDGFDISIKDFVSCPENWLQHDRHCYNLVSGFLASVEPFNDVDPAVHCGMHKAYMAVIPDMETNEVIASLGLVCGLLIPCSLS